jgi:formylglycine-generating enzyme required for sulfatase activity
MHGEKADRGHVFLSHAGQDAVLARSIAEGLRCAGIDVWCDLLEGGLPHGRAWVRRLEAALEDSVATVILIGERGIDGWVRAECDYAVNRGALDPEYRVIPVLAPGVDVGSLPPLLQRYQAFFVQTDDDRVPQEVVTRLAVDLRRGEAAEGVDPDGVFPGLSAFEERQAPYLFGRTSETVHLCGLLGEVGDGDFRRGLLLHGDSGAGKSSLVRAGLVPAIRRGWLRGIPTDREWMVVELRPGRDPILNLAEALVRASGKSSIPKVRERLRKGEDALALVLREVRPERSLVLLLLDQMEELFTLAADRPGAVEAADELLAAALSDRDRPFYLIATIRTDFLDQADARLPRLAAVLEEVGTKHHVPAMRRREALQAAIGGPVALAGLEWDEGLDDHLLRDALRAEVSLPLLAHVLWELAHRRRGSTLTLRSYHDIGEIGGALATSADRALRRLTPAQRDRALALFEELVRFGGNRSRDTRRTISRAEALRILGGGDAAAGILTCLSGGRGPGWPEDARPAPRLVVVSGQPGQERVDLAHEELLRSWPTLTERIEANRERREMLEDLRGLARQWLNLNRDPEVLVGGRRLETFRKALEALLLESSPESEFLRMSKLVEDARRSGRVPMGGGAGLHGSGPAVSDAQGFSSGAAAGGEGGSVAREEDQRRAALMVKLATEVEAAESRDPSGDELAYLRRLHDGFMAPDLLPPFRDSGKQWGDLLREECERWASVIEDVSREDSPYRALRLRPQEGLLPLGRDSRTGLWEFAVGWTGSVPAFDSEHGGAARSEDAAVVLVLIPGGRFWMGAQNMDPRGPGFDEDANSAEGPVREVVVSSFFLAKHPVSVPEWARLRQSSAGNPVGMKPAIHISWLEAKAFCARVDLTLPSEAQWEYACRAETTTQYWSGNGEKSLARAGWFTMNSGGRLRSVAAKPANPFGLHDMHGNVLEWCEDAFVESYDGAASDGRARVRPGATSRVVRGGSWRGPALVARSAYRDWYEANTRRLDLGFRPARVVTEDGISSTDHRVGG